MSIGKIYVILFCASVFFISCSNLPKTDRTKENTAINFYLDKTWPAIPHDFKLGNPAGIGIDTSQHIFIFCRAGREWPLIGSMPKTYISAKPILMLDKESGKILNSWGDGIFIMPHGLTIDKSNNVWVTDVGLNQVFKFTHDGKLLMQLGEAKVSGNDSLHFNRPTDVAIASDGAFYVSDGYGNSRVIKFSPSGKYLFQWGTKGNKAGEFKIPHALCLDEKGNVYVADRENCRIQVFNSNGKFIAEWTDKSFGHLCSITHDPVSGDFIIVDDATSWFGLRHNGSDIIIIDSSGKILSRFGRSGSYTGPKCWYHDVAVDDEGNIYVEDILGNRIQKFKKIFNLP